MLASGGDPYLSKIENDMQVSALIGLSQETTKLFQVYSSGFLLGTLNANDEDRARQLLVTELTLQSQCFLNWEELRAVEVMRS